MAATRIEGDVLINGTLTVVTDLNAPASSITNAAIDSAAGIEATKLEHQYQPVYAQGSGTTAAAATETLYVAYGAGTLIAFRAGSVVANVGAATCTVDLKKNGTTMLSAVITLDSANTARVVEAATLSVTSIAAGDVLEVVVTASAGGGTLATGLFCQAIIREASAP